MKPHVYLAGPIAGLTFQGATDWRQVALDALADLGIVGLSPMRDKIHLNQEAILSPFGYDKDPLCTERAIVARDHHDLRRSDAVLLNLLGAERVSIGSMFEAAWCFVFRKPLVMIMEPSDNLHDHAFVRQAGDIWVHTLEDGIQSVASIVLP